MARYLPEWVPASILAIVLLAILFVMCSCQQAQQTINETDFDQAAKLVDLMNRAGIAGWVEIDLGDGKVYMHNEWGLNLGTVRLRMMSRPHASSVIDERGPPG